jgi:uncharacterized membrane protein
VKNGPSLDLGPRVLGFALGGFIDGILLHQVLQLAPPRSASGKARPSATSGAVLGWHVPRAHVRHRRSLACGSCGGRGAASRAEHLDLRIVAAALFGFSAWQLVDVAGFHWIIGIHRVRVDVPNPLVWDIGWLLAFGGPSLIAGLWLWRQARP